MGAGETPSNGHARGSLTLGIIGAAALCRECIALHLTAQSEILAEDLGSGGPETMDRIRSADPDVVLVDLPPSEALSLVAAILDAAPGTAPVALHRGLGTEHLVRLAEAGYVGFIAADCGLRDALDELRCVARREFIGSPALAGALIRSLQQRRRDSGDVGSGAQFAPLSAREREVAELLELRYSNKEIAAALGIEFGTVKNHVHNVLTKLHLRNRWDLLPVKPRPATPRSRSLDTGTRPTD